MILPRWRTSGVGNDEPQGSIATSMTAPTRRDSVIVRVELPADAPQPPSWAESSYGADPPVATDGSAIAYESCADGTGGSKVSAFALAVTHDVTNEADDAGERRGKLGYALGPARSDRAELAGLVLQLLLAPMTPVTVRLVSDCLAMLLLLRWAITASLARVLEHEHRGLLLEWRRLLAARKTAGAALPFLGWMRGHAVRQDHPYPVQDWCDRAAPLAALAPPDTDFRPAEAEPVFTLWDKRSGTPVYGGWASILEQRSTELLTRQVQQSAQTGPRAWHALNTHGPEIEEWGRTPLASRTSEQARCRSAAQADTVWGQGTRSRWEHEQHWRLTGELHNLSRLCTACGREGDQLPNSCPQQAAVEPRGSSRANSSLAITGSRDVPSEAHDTWDSVTA